MRRPRTSWEAGAHELLETQAQIYAEVLRTIDPDEAPHEVTHATAGGDERKLRGIPAIGRGVAGATTGDRVDDPRSSPFRRRRIVA